MALRDLGYAIRVQKMQLGGFVGRLAKIMKVSEAEASKAARAAADAKITAEGISIGGSARATRQLDIIADYVKQAEKLQKSGKKVYFTKTGKIRGKATGETPPKGETLKPGENPVDHVKKNEGTKSTTGTSDKKGNVENPLKKEAETAQKEAAEATKETKATTSKPAEKPAEEPKTNTETQGEPRHSQVATFNGEKYYYNKYKKVWQSASDFKDAEVARTNRPAVPDNVAPESADTGLRGYNEYQPGETIKHGDKRLFDGKLKQFDENSGEWESIKDWERENNPEAQSPQQQGVISRLHNWLIGPAAPAGSEVAWNPQGILRRYADLRPYVEGRPFLYNPWVSTTALWTLAGGNEGHKRGYSYPDSYSVGFQSSPLMRILGIASGLTGVGDTFEEMERNGVIQKVNRNGNRQVAAAPQNYLDWDSLTDMDMAYNPYGGYTDNISPDFLED